MNEIKMIPINKLFPHKDNPRKNLGDLTELADSIRTNGIMQNLTVIPSGKDSYTVLIGHRRLEAAKLAGLSELPCAIVEMDEREQVATMLLENIQRSDLTAWEQAKGFQMMLDLGDTVEGISEKTGFSKSTIHRRLKIAELDEEAYKESEGRQVTLEEYLNLSSIEDVKKRNELLKSIGTPNFDWEYRRVLNEQIINAAMMSILPVLEEQHIKKITGSEHKYNRLKSIPFADFSSEQLDFGEDIKNLYYSVNEYNKSIDIFTDWPKEKKTDQNSKAKELQQRVDKAKEDINALKAMAYNLRRDFAVGLRLTAKNAPLVLRGSLMANIFVDYYATHSPSLLDEVFPLSDSETPTKNIYGNERRKRYIQRLTDNPSMAPFFVYISFEDDDNQGYGGDQYVGGAWVPCYRGSDKLDAIYDWLISLGYQMSDEEKALRDGTHEIYHRFDAEIAANESDDDDDDYDEEEDDFEEGEDYDEEDEDSEEE